ncbi:MAG: tRNA (adenosine(37)-N6)-threonylcarbamoyltransferase complex dimerization subunit type 1 TsaB [Candidatus Margulisiibacteriota bacterium]
MRVLGISTPAKYVSISIADISVESGAVRQNIIAEFSSFGSKSEDLTALAQEIFRVSKTDIKSIELISVVQGPGSYSGLRGGLAAAKSFAQALDIPIVGVSALETMAGELINIEGTIAVILDAVKDEYNFALFSVSGQKISRLSEDTVLTKEKLGGLLDNFKMPVCVASPYDDIKGLSGNGNIINVKTFARAVNAGLSGYEKFHAGKSGDVLKMVPDYSHTPKIKEYKR